MTTATVRLTGDALLQHHNQMVMDAGYYDVENKRVLYVDYYTAMLNSEKVLTVVHKRDAEDAEYEALSGEEQDLYDHVHDKFGYQWSHEQIMEFMDELGNIGITTPEQVDDAYEWDTYEYNPEEKFAEYFVTEVLCQGLPGIVEGCVDWEAVWDTSLRYDYNTIEFDGITYFFRNC